MTIEEEIAVFNRAMDDAHAERRARIAAGTMPPRPPTTMASLQAEWDAEDAEIQKMLSHPATAKEKP